MMFETLALLVAMAVVWAAVVLTDAQLTTAGSARARRRAVDACARRAGLAWDPLLAPALLPRLRRREHAVLATALVALVVVVAVLATGWWVPGDYAAYFVVAATALLARAVAVAVVGAREQLAAPDGPRIARLDPPAPADYLSTSLRRWSAWFPPAAALVSAGAVLVTVLDPWDGGEPSTKVGLALILLLAALTAAAVEGSAVVSRRIAGRGQPAGDERTLCWSDALRARTLEDVAHTPPVLAGAMLGVACGTVLSVLPPPNLLSPWPSLVVSAVAYLGMVVALLALLLPVFRPGLREEHAYLARLWPQVAAVGRSTTPPPGPAGAGTPSTTGASAC